MPNFRSEPPNYVLHSRTNQETQASAPSDLAYDPRQEPHLGRVTTSRREAELSGVAIAPNSPCGPMRPRGAVCQDKSLRLRRSSSLRLVVPVTATLNFPDDCALAPVASAKTRTRGKAASASDTSSCCASFGLVEG